MLFNLCCKEEVQKSILLVRVTLYKQQARMFKYMIFLLMFLLLMQSSNAQHRKNVQKLQEQIETTLMIPNTHFGVAFKDMQTGDSLLINAKDAFHAASTMKTPVLMELFRQAQQGRFAMTDSIVIRNSLKGIVDASE